MKYSSHAQYINDKQIEVPSVTTILKILNKPSINKWANYLGFKREKIDDVLKFSADKGTEVHYMLHAFLFQMKYIFVESDNGVTKDYLIKVLDNFISWSGDHTIKPIFGEKSITCDLFGGTVDLYCELDGIPTILDFKTSKSFYSSMFLQLSAYTYMMEMLDYEVEQVCILLINEKMCKHKILKRDELDKYIATFLILTKLFYQIYELNEDWGDLLEKK